MSFHLPFLLRLANCQVSHENALQADGTTFLLAAYDLGRICPLGLGFRLRHVALDHWLLLILLRSADLLTLFYDRVFPLVQVDKFLDRAHDIHSLGP